MLTIEQTDAAIRETFYNMEEGAEYVLNDYWYAETNRIRKQYSYLPLKDKQEYKFYRKGDLLFLNSGFIFDFDGKVNLSFCIGYNFVPAPCFAITFALQHKGIEKLNKDNCEGKVVEIDGRKYKLTAV